MEEEYVKSVGELKAEAFDLIIERQKAKVVYAQLDAKVKEVVDKIIKLQGEENGEQKQAISGDDSKERDEKSEEVSG